MEIIIHTTEVMVSRSIIHVLTILKKNLQKRNESSIINTKLILSTSSLVPTQKTTSVLLLMTGQVHHSLLALVTLPHLPVQNRTNTHMQETQLLITRTLLALPLIMASVSAMIHPSNQKTPISPPLLKEAQLMEQLFVITMDSLISILVESLAQPVISSLSQATMTMITFQKLHTLILMPDALVLTLIGITPESRVHSISINHTMVKPWLMSTLTIFRETADMASSSTDWHLLVMVAILTSSEEHLLMDISAHL